MLLLDTSVVSGALNSGSPKHALIQKFLASNTLYQDQIFISAITVSETIFGLNIYKRKKPPHPQAKVDEIEKRVKGIIQTWKILPVDEHVAKHHADLRAAYAEHKAPNLVSSNKGLKNVPVELWHTTMPSTLLQISENDLWIAAVALNYNLTLASADKGHEELKKAYPQLFLQML